jgi:hypothetical protein
MWHTTNSGRRGAYDAEAAVLWIFACIIVVIAFRDVLPLLVVALAIVTAAWWASHNLDHRVARDHATTASVTNLREALTGQRDLKRAPAQSSRRGPRAA